MVSYSGASTGITGKTRVYFDGKCHLCSKEIILYKKQDVAGKIDFIDITSPYFNAAAEGLDAEVLNRSLHVRTADGEMLSGLNSFMEIWKALGRYRLLVWIVSRKSLRPFLDRIYDAFAVVRLRLPKRKSALCVDGTCELKLPA